MNTTAAPSPPPTSRPHPAGATLELRLLETTDVHANLLAHDYFTDTPARGYGLTRTATLIARARAEVPNCLLFDNGDFLQGTPISDLTAQPGSGWDAPHPAILAMNRLRYDAAALGNHEFNFGLDWLRAALAAAEFPVICANALTRQGRTAAEDETLLPPWLILERPVTDSTGAAHRLRIGVIGLLPPQFTTWDRAHLAGRIFARDMVETARALLPGIRAAGADIVVALAHTGIDDAPPRPMMENAALPLAALPGIDAVLAGHSHQVFPSPALSGARGVDAAAGTLHGTPAVMAGFRGSHLGVLDLTLRHTGGRWQVAGHRAEARPAASAPQDNELRRVLGPAHAATRRLADRPIGNSATALHSYLALARSDPGVRLVTRAQRAALAHALHGTPHEGLPILSASAPFRTGGRGGPWHYTDIPPGPLRLRHAADLYPFPNTLCGLRLDGAQLRDWLERAAACFNRLRPGETDQPLCNASVPGHDFDMIDGLTYTIDLSQPARYDPAGSLVAPDARRIRDLRFDSQPLDDAAAFILATNSYRASGAGPFARTQPETVVHAGSRPIRDLLVGYLSQGGDIAADAAPIWRFAALPPGTSALFDTGPGLRRYSDEHGALGATDTGDTATGFARLRLPMDQGSHVAPACESVR